jgi:hypothetical protein
MEGRGVDKRRKPFVYKVLLIWEVIPTTGETKSADKDFANQ